MHSEVIVGAIPQNDPSSKLVNGFGLKFFTEGLVNNYSTDFILDHIQQGEFLICINYNVNLWFL